ncbi:hypothetical protein [Bradyrhizobium daqingense]|uniref:hypothetical protein n=1 Tax=Bradyrhizobium daqingense TaxID=993502 RepID=UPI003838461C
MTAINVFKSSDAVHVFSDGLWCDPVTGKPAGKGTKILVLPELNALVGVTGLSPVPFLLSPLLIETPFDDLRSLVDAMPDLVKTCYAQGKAAGQNFTGRCDVVLAGWSENAGALIHVVECYPHHDIFKARPDEQYIQPKVVGSADMFFPEDGLRLLEKQRAAKFSRPDAGTFGSTTVTGLVGGFAQYTQIDSDGIRIKVLARWPDNIQ